MGILGMVSPNINALPIDLAPRQIVSTVAALQNVGGNIGGALAPMVTGLLYGMTGNFQVALLVTGGVALVFGTLVHVVLLGQIEPCIGIKK
jgi:ACS family glucarate transporter-like MFS transporter